MSDRQTYYTAAHSDTNSTDQIYSHTLRVSSEQKMADRSKRRKDIKD